MLKKKFIVNVNVGWRHIWKHLPNSFSKPLKRRHINSQRRRLKASKRPKNQKKLRKKRLQERKIIKKEDKLQNSDSHIFKKWNSVHLAKILYRYWLIKRVNSTYYWLSSLACKNQGWDYLHPCSSPWAYQDPLLFWANHWDFYGRFLPPASANLLASRACLLI